MAEPCPTCDGIELRTLRARLTEVQAERHQWREACERAALETGHEIVNRHRAEARLAAVEALCDRWDRDEMGEDEFLDRVRATARGEVDRPADTSEESCATTTAPANATDAVVPAADRGAGSRSATGRTVDLPQGTATVASRTWTIDVCNTCGAHAVWPFSCGHRPQHFNLDTPPWCSPVTVRGNWKPRGEGDRADR